MREVPVPARNYDAASWLTAIEREAILRFKERVGALPGAAVQRVILFGSRARGEGDEGSDLDLAVILAGDDGPYWRQIVDVATELNLEHEYRVQVSPLIVSQARLVELWDRERAIAHASRGDRDVNEANRVANARAEVEASEEELLNGGLLRSAVSRLYHLSL
jgi:predicted nucleotidyltransferase